MKKPKFSPPVPPEPVISPDKIQELIRNRAYELYEQRGREDGRDFDDWIAAESEVTGNSGGSLGPGTERPSVHGRRKSYASRMLA